MRQKTFRFLHHFIEIKQTIYLLLVEILTIKVLI